MLFCVAPLVVGWCDADTQPKTKHQSAPDMAVKPPMELPAMKKGERTTSMAKSRTWFFGGMFLGCMCERERDGAVYLV